MHIGIADKTRRRMTAADADRRLSRDAIASLIIHACFQFGNSMSGVFLNLYLWRLTHSLWINGMYNVISFLVTPIWFAVGGWLAKKTDRLLSYRIGVFMIALFYLAVVLAKEKVVDYYALFAICQSIAGSFYWISYLVLQYDVSTDRNRIRYVSLNNICFMIAGLAGPALAGFLITRFNGLHGYTLVFSIAFIMFILTAIGSFAIKAERTNRKAYYLKYAGLLMRKNPEWHRSLYAYFVICMLQGLMMLLPNLLLFSVLPREDGIGYFGVLFSAVGIVVGFRLAKLKNSDRPFKFLLAAAIGYTLGTLPLLWRINLLTVVVFMIMYTGCSILQGNLMSTYYYRLTGLLPLKGKLRVESVVIREVFVETGRAASIFLLILLTGSLSGWKLTLVLLGVVLLQFPVAWMIRPQGTVQEKAAKNPLYKS